MTLDELEQRLVAMPADEKARFLRDLGNLEEKRCLEVFAKDPLWELRICRALGVTSQPEKIGRATLDAAWYAKGAFVAALIGIIISLILGLVSIAMSRGG